MSGILSRVPSTFVIALAALSATVLLLPSTFWISGLASEGQLSDDLFRDQIVVRFHEDRQNRVAETALTNLHGASSRREFPFESHLATYSFDSSVDTSRVLAAIRRSPHVRFADFDSRITLSGLPIIPNDPEFSPEQWNMHNTGQESGTNDVDIDAPEVWEDSTGSGTVTIATIDTGVRTTHEDLSSNLISGRNVVLNNSNVEDTAPHSHGTAIAGIIGAVGNNSKGVAGLNWSIDIMPVVWLRYFFDEQGQLQIEGGGQSHAVAAMAYARNNGVRIMNCSFNGGPNMTLVNNEIALGKTQDVLYVFSSGNAANGQSNGINVDSGGFGEEPCMTLHENVICATAVDRNGNRGSWANYGRKGVHLGAPGADLTSTLKDSNTSYGKPAHVSVPFPAGSGTSYAAPHVVGTLALMKALNPSYTWRQLKEYLLLAAQPTPTGDLDEKTHTGNMLNADAAILAFGDSFDDATPGSGQHFFSNTTTGARWALGEHVVGGKCDSIVQEVGGSVDRVAEVSYSGLITTPGSSFTLAAFENTYVPGAEVQTLAVRVTTTDGSSVSGKTGRIAVGVVGETGKTNPTCAASNKSYTKMTFGGSVFAGIDLGTRKPFIYFDPPFSETVYTAISSSALSGVKKLSIALGLGTTSASMWISDSRTGEILFSQTGISYPNPWNWTGTDKGAFLYYGLGAGSGTLWVRSFVSARP